MNLIASSKGLSVILVALFLPTCLSVGTSLIFPHYPGTGLDEIANYVHIDDVTSLNVSLAGGREGGRRFERQTLERLNTKMFHVKVTGPKTSRAFQFLNCSVTESPFIELKRFTSQKNGNDVDLHVLVTSRGRLSQTELQIQCAVDFLADCAWDKFGNCTYFELTLPLSIIRSWADKVLFNTLAHSRTGLSLLVLFCMSCSITMRQVFVKRQLVGVTVTLLLNMAVSPFVSTDTEVFFVYFSQFA